MSDELRVAILVGIAVAVAYLVLRHFRSEGIRLSDLLEAIGLSVTPLVMPGSAEMIVKAFGSAELPIFNEAENRIALIVGGAVLIGALLYGDGVALHRAWKNKRA